MIQVVVPSKVDSRVMLRVLPLMTPFGLERQTEVDIEGYVKVELRVVELRIV